MPGQIRSLRAHSLFALTGLLLGAAGLATSCWESVSFGHAHLAGGLAAHHNHVHLGEHEHSDPSVGHHHSEAPASHGRGEPKRKTSTSVSLVPMLFQPVGTSVLEVQLAEAAPGVLALALSLAVQVVIRLAPPRGPPCLLATPDEERLV